MSDADYEHITDGLKLVARITLENISALPLGQKIMACDGLAHALKADCPIESRAATELADALRSAEFRQSNFLALLAS